LNIIQTLIALVSKSRMLQLLNGDISLPPKHLRKKEVQGNSVTAEAARNPWANGNRESFSSAAPAKVRTSSHKIYT
jgi:hypothetical protein